MTSASVPPAAEGLDPGRPVTQEQLRGYFEIVRLTNLRAIKRQALLNLIAVGASVEPGPLSIAVVERAVVKVTRETVGQVIDPESFAQLLARIPEQVIPFVYVGTPEYLRQYRQRSCPPHPENAATLREPTGRPASSGEATVDRPFCALLSPLKLNRQVHRCERTGCDPDACCCAVLEESPNRHDCRL